MKLEGIEDNAWWFVTMLKDMDWGEKDMPNIPCCPAWERNRVVVAIFFHEGLAY